jgi:hypothetical protein
VNDEKWKEAIGQAIEMLALQIPNDMLEWQDRPIQDAASLQDVCAGLANGTSGQDLEEVLRSNELSVRGSKACKLIRLVKYSAGV